MKRKFTLAWYLPSLIINWRSRIIWRFFPNHKFNFDRLTCVLTRPAFMFHLKKKLNGTENHEAFTFVMLDIDDLKQINDKLDMISGDFFITSLSKIIMKRISKSELICRAGGDEFWILFESKSKENVFDIVESIRSDYKEITLEGYDGETYSKTVSCGICNSISDIESMLWETDKSMYMAYRNGGDQTLSEPMKVGEK